MNEINIPEELLAAAAGGASGTVQLGEADKALENGQCPFCGTQITFVAQTGQQTGTGNITATYYCMSCKKIFQKITYLSGNHLWGEIRP